MNNKCDSCNQIRPNLVAAVVGDVYYARICQKCLGSNDEKLSGNTASFNRRRDWEDNAADTVQPYDAVGANPEFLRLYPEAAAKVFSPETIEQLKKKI